MAKTILAVDDSSSLRQMVAFSLKAAGYQVVEAVDGQDGLEKAKLQTVDLVLTDQNMPKMDGLTLIKSLRGLPTYAKVPILMLTAKSSQQDRIHGLEIGADDYVTKPFSARELPARVRVLGRRAPALRGRSRSTVRRTAAARSSVSLR